MKNPAPYAIVFAVMIGTAAAADGDTWDCKVQSFNNVSSVHGPDNAFVEANKRKTFTIVDGGEKITVAMRSPDFDSGSNQYVVIKRDILSDAGVADGAVGLEGVVIEKNPADEYDGATAASITVQSGTSLSVWFLSCQKL